MCLHFFPQSSGGSTGLTGTCLTEDECNNRAGGVKSGNCASGFGVCCVTSVNTCGSTVNDNCTYIQNPGYPTAFDGTACQYTIKQSADVCQIRLDYQTFSIRGPDLTLDGNRECDLDSWTITGGNSLAPATPAALANHNPPVICGLATGQHMYIDVGGSTTTDLTVAFAGSATGTNRNWNVKVSYIHCDSEYLVPTGCGQYLTGVSGNVKSFNFDVTTAAEVWIELETIA